MGDKKELWLSASKVKTYLNCSYKFYATYLLKLPREGNYGSARGGAAHSVFQCLLKKNRREYVKRILDGGTIYAVPSIVRMVKWLLNKEGFGDQFDNKGQDNYKMIDEMIVVGLAYDFFCDEEDLDADFAETLFKLESKNPRYKILGYIDKFSRKDGRGIIRDYKSSSEPFTEKELDFEIQAMSYLLYTKRVLEMDGFVEFLFLRFPDDMVRKVEVSQEQLDGFEQFLGDLYSHMENFTEENALENMAWDKGFPSKEDGFSKKLMCGFAKFPNQLKKDGNLMFVCPEAFPFDYYVALDEDGEIIKSSKSKDELSSYKKVEIRHYAGCPRKINTTEYKEWLEKNS